MTRHSSHHVVDELTTCDELIQFWRRLDEPLTDQELHELWNPRTPRRVVIARWVVALFIVSVVALLPTMLRAVGSALG